MGSEVPDGTYFYVVVATNKLTGTVKKFSGSLTINDKEVMKKGVETQKGVGVQLFVLHKKTIYFRLGLFLAILVFTNCGIYAQQQPMYSQYMFQYAEYQPGLCRQQGCNRYYRVIPQSVAGIDDAPKTTVLPWICRQITKGSDWVFSCITINWELKKAQDSMHHTRFGFQYLTPEPFSLGLQAGLAELPG